eukprot:426247_1
MSTEQSSQLVIACFHTATLCLVIVLLIMSFPTLYTHTNIGKTSRWMVIWFFVFTILAETCISLSLWLSIALHSYKYHLQDYTWFQILHFAAIILDNSAQATTYLLFTYRLYLTFQDSSYQSSKCTFIILYLSILIYLICQISYAIINTYTNIFDVNVGIDALISSIVVEALDIFILLFILYLFLQKLFRIIATGINLNKHNIIQTQVTLLDDVELSLSHYSKSNDQHMDQHKTTTAPTLSTFALNEEQLRLLYIGTKMSVLTLWMLFAFQFFQIADLAANIYYVLNGKYNMSIFYVTWLSWSLQTIISTICVYLSFKFSDHTYKKLCGQCHLMTTSACEKWIRYDVKYSFQRY